MASRKDSPQKSPKVLTKKKTDAKKPRRLRQPVSGVALFRDHQGRFINKVGFAQLLKEDRVKFKYANGKRIGGSRKGFIFKVLQSYNATREEIRLQRIAARRKRERKTGKKIEKPDKPIKPEYVGVKERPKGYIKTYIRWSFVVKDLDGRYVTDGRNAGVYAANIGLEEALRLTDFNYYFAPEAAKVLSGDYVLTDGGIHYYRFREDSDGVRYIEDGSEYRCDADGLLDNI